MYMYISLVFFHRISPVVIPYTHISSSSSPVVPHQLLISHSTTLAPHLPQSHISSSSSIVPPTLAFHLPQYHISSSSSIVPHQLLIFHSTTLAPHLFVSHIWNTLHTNARFFSDGNGRVRSYIRMVRMVHVPPHLIEQPCGIVYIVSLPHSGFNTIYLYNSHS